MTQKPLQRERPAKNLPVRAPKLPHIVAQQLRSQIASGALRPGDRLPPEAQLVKEFGISRPTLREALRVLESETLIQLDRGARKGAEVLSPSIEVAAQYGGLYLATHDTTLQQIHDVRTVLEPPLAAQHAKSSRKAVIEALEACVQEQRIAMSHFDYIAAAKAVNAFHGLLVSKSGNTVLRLLAGMLHEISEYVYPQLPVTAGRLSKKATLSRSEASTDAHQQLVALIRARKADAAEDFWRNYMLDTAKWLKKSGLSKLRVDFSSRG
jgi:GntR family transcriptional repressor for pyruvate dehydrogenase complex